jgi:hypothetical protein
MPWLSHFADSAYRSRQTARMMLEVKVILTGTPGNAFWTSSLKKPPAGARWRSVVDRFFRHLLSIERPVPLL